jgi:hypothetical protein
LSVLARKGAIQQLFRISRDCVPLFPRESEQSAAHHPGRERQYDGHRQRSERGGGGLLDFIGGAGNATVYGGTGMTSPAPPGWSRIRRSVAMKGLMVRRLPPASSSMAGWIPAGMIYWLPAAASSSGGSMTLTPSDNTQITFLNVGDVSQLQGRIASP